MKVFDPGHSYGLNLFDGEVSPAESPEYFYLHFVKRMGPDYPGNTSDHPGTTLQEVLRACIDRLMYVYAQRPDEHTYLAMLNLKGAVLELEIRAALRAGRSTDFSIEKAVHGEICVLCGHIKCKGECRAKKDHADGRSNLCQGTTTGSITPETSGSKRVTSSPTRPKRTKANNRNRSGNRG